MCGYYLDRTKYKFGSCYDPVKAAPYINARPNAVRFIQYRYVDYTTGYSGSGLTCNFTASNCKNAILSAQLWK